MGKRKGLAGTRGKRRVRGVVERGKGTVCGCGESGWFWQAREEDRSGEERSGGGRLVLAKSGRPMGRLREESEGAACGVGFLC